MSNDKDTTYNGYTNYETWNVKLWIDNEQGSSEYWQEQAQDIWNHAEAGQYDWETREEVFTRELADRLKDEHEENAPTSEASVYTDLLGAALSEVNWREIAETYLYDLDRSADEDDDETEDEDAEIEKGTSHE